jgi:hypothetical protein
MTESFEEGRQYKVVYLDEIVIYGEVLDITDTHYVIQTRKGIVHRAKNNVLKIDPVKQDRYESDVA